MSASPIIEARKEGLAPYVELSEVRVGDEQRFYNHGKDRTEIRMWLGDRWKLVRIGHI